MADVVVGLVLLIFYYTYTQQSIMCCVRHSWTIISFACLPGYIPIPSPTYRISHYGEGNICQKYLPALVCVCPLLYKSIVGSLGKKDTQQLTH